MGICAGGGFRESLPGFSLLPMPSRSQIPSRASLKLRCVIVEDQVLFEQLLRLTLESVGLVDVVAVAHTAVCIGYGRLGRVGTGRGCRMSRRFVCLV